MIAFGKLKWWFCCEVYWKDIYPAVVDAGNNAIVGPEADLRLFSETLGAKLSFEMVNYV